jgi:hypothetical protein
MYILLLPYIKLIGRKIGLYYIPKVKGKVFPSTGLGGP